MPNIGLIEAYLVTGPQIFMYNEFEGQTFPCTSMTNGTYFCAYPNSSDHPSYLTGTSVMFILISWRTFQSLMTIWCALQESKYSRTTTTKTWCSGGGTWC